MAEPFQLGASQNQAGTGSSSSGGGLPGLQANANLGLFQVPISASFLNPSATSTSTFSPTVYANPNFKLGALSNVLNLGPQFASGGTSSSASFFGGGGKGGGGGGGSILDNIDFHPSTTLVSNLPPPLQAPPLSSLLNGAFPQNIMTAPNMMPMPAPSSPLAGMMNTTQPIAAGGISPTSAGPIQAAQSMGGSQNVSQSYTGSAAQAGGYDQPPQQSPMPGFSYPQRQGLSPASMSQFLMPQAMALPPLQSQQAQMDQPSQPMQGGAGQAVTPAMPIDAEHQEILDGLKGLEGKAPAAAGGAIKAFNETTAEALKQHAAATKPLKEKLATENSALEAARDSAKKLMDPGEAQKLADNVKAQVYATKSPAQKAAIDRFETGTSGMVENAPHPIKDMLRTLGRGLEGGFGMTGQIYAQETRDYNRAHLKYLTATRQQAADQHEHDKFMEQVHQRIGDIHNATSNDLSATKSIVDDTRSALNHADTQLKSNVEMAKDMTFGPANEYMKGLTGEANVLSKESTVYGAGVSERQRQQGLGYQARNTAANERRANTGAESFQLQSLKNEQAQEKSNLEKQKLKEQLAGNQWTGKFASLEPKNTGIPLGDYEDYLLQQVQTGKIDKQTAREARDKAKLKLKQ